MSESKITPCCNEEAEYHHHRPYGGNAVYGCPNCDKLYNAEAFDEPAAPSAATPAPVSRTQLANDRANADIARAFPPTVSAPDVAALIAEWEQLRFHAGWNAPKVIVPTRLVEEIVASIRRLSAPAGDDAAYDVQLCADLRLSDIGLRAQNICGEAATRIEQLSAQVAESKRERLARSKIDPVTRMHNLCDHLAEHRNESPYNAEALELADASYKELCAKLKAIELLAQQRGERIDSLFDAIAHGDEKHRAWLKDAIDRHFALAAQDKDAK